MTGAQTILIAGAKHSRANAAKIRAWIAETRLDAVNARAYVRDYEKRGYLTKADAETLIQELS